MPTFSHGRNPSPAPSRHTTGSRAGKINEPALHIRVDLVDADVVAHFQPLEAEGQPAFGRWLEQPYPRAFVRRPGDNGIE